MAKTRSTSSVRVRRLRAVGFADVFKGFLDTGHHAEAWPRHCVLGRPIAPMNEPPAPKALHDPAVLHLRRPSIVRQIPIGLDKQQNKTVCQRELKSRRKARMDCSNRLVVDIQDRDLGILAGWRSGAARLLGRCGR